MGVASCESHVYVVSLKLTALQSIQWQTGCLLMWVVWRHWPQWPVSQRDGVVFGTVKRNTLYMGCNADNGSTIMIALSNASFAVLVWTTGNCHFFLCRGFSVQKLLNWILSWSPQLCTNGRLIQIIHAVQGLLEVRYISRWVFTSNYTVILTSSEHLCRSPLKQRVLVHTIWPEPYDF